MDFGRRTLYSKPPNKIKVLYQRDWCRRNFS